MDILQRVWPSLDERQRKLLEDMALTLSGAPAVSEDEYLTVSQIHERYGRSHSSVYKAMNRDALPYRTPKGQERPRYAKRTDVERWLGYS